MTRRGGRRATHEVGLLLALAASVGLLAPVRVAAQQAAAQHAATQDPDADPQYEAILKDAVSDYNSGDFAEARALFRKANDLHPNARTLRGMGMASFELKEYVHALRSLRAALASKVKPLTTAQRAGTEELISRASAFVGRYTLQIAPKGVRAIVQVDGAPATVEPDGTLVLNLGRHQLTVTCPTCPPFHRAIEVRGGEEEPLVIHLQQQEPVRAAPAMRAAAPAKPAPPVVPAPTASTAHQPGPPSRATAWWLLGGAGVAAVAALGTGLWWANRNDEIHTCDTGILRGLECRNRNTLVTQRNLAVGLTAVLGAGAVGLGIAGALKAAHGGSTDGSRERSAQAGLRCTPSFGGGACILRF